MIKTWAVKEDLKSKRRDIALYGPEDKSLYATLENGVIRIGFINFVANEVSLLEEVRIK